MPAKRSREDDEFSEQAKRRKRSETNASSTTIELGEEDKLLIQLKDEDGMPWKDIAARFQSDLGKTYQIPALQMRLKRLRERMRVWTETDVRALRMAHEYWVQSKFDIISQKVSISSITSNKCEKTNSSRCSNSALQRNGPLASVPASGLK
jgi:methylphosphotriester-DNA--protein-cysteine methyltransferase